jgi:hypothetical protein
LERHPEHPNYRKPFATSVVISHALYVQAYQWTKNPARVTVSLGDEFFSRPELSPSLQLSTADVKAYKRHVQKLDFASFDSYHDIVNGMRRTVLNRAEYLKSTCTCPTYFREYVCKHIIGIASLQKIEPIPSKAKSVPIGAKPRRGRPTATAKALTAPAVEPAAPAPVAPAAPAKARNRRAAAAATPAPTPLAAAAPAVEPAAPAPVAPAAPAKKKGSKRKATPEPCASAQSSLRSSKRRC